MMDSTPGKSPRLIAPFGGELKNLLVTGDEAIELRHLAESLPSISLSTRSLCDLELLATGAFSPLDRFMGSADYDRVLREMRLADGTLFPMPVTLPIASDIVLDIGSEVTLRDLQNNPLAVLCVEEVYPWNKGEFAEQVLQTQNVRHPLVSEMRSWGDRFVSGKLRVFQMPRYYDFPRLRLSPIEVRRRLENLGNSNVVAFQTRNPLHRGHEELVRRAMKEVDGVLLLHPVVGLTKPGDVDHHVRVRSYIELVRNYFRDDRVLLSLLPLAMRFAGPREALWHAIIRRNFGANHFIVGRDHASPGSDEHGDPFYEADAAREFVESFSSEIGVRVLSFDEFVYLPDTGEYEERSKVSEETKFVSMTGTKVRDDFLNRDVPLPEWLMRPEVGRLLEDSYPPKSKKGICIWFTGLSASGKSTTAEILTSMLAAHGRRVTLLDGDIVRTNLSKGLGFDRAGRDANVRRIGFVASEIVRHGGVAVCAAISPYRKARNEVRELVGNDSFIEVFVNTPLEICEERDPKGLYAKARRGEIKEFTGLDDVYEEPRSPELTIETLDQTAEENSMRIIHYLIDRGMLQRIEHYDDE